jgi:hypothetical protein
MGRSSPHSTNSLGFKLAQSAIITRRLLLSVTYNLPLGLGISVIITVIAASVIAPPAIASSSLSESSPAS